MLDPVLKEYGCDNWSAANMIKIMWRLSKIPVCTDLGDRFHDIRYGLYRLMFFNGGFENLLEASLKNFNRNRRMMV